MNTIPMHKRLSDRQLQQPPYDWMENVNLTLGIYTPPAGVTVCEIRSKKEGTINIDTVNNTTVDWFCTTYDILRQETIQINIAGTSAALYTQSISVHGFINEDFVSKDSGV